MATKRIGKNQRPYFQKARDSALLAVEVYNKPAVKFTSEGYIAPMVMAWTALMHAIFLRKGKSPYYKDPNRRYIKVDGDFKHWELAECAKQFWGADTANPIRKNLEFFIPLRNKIEHRHIPQLDGAIFGECQALLLNFDALLGQQFGAKHQLRESRESVVLAPVVSQWRVVRTGCQGQQELGRSQEVHRGLSGDAERRSSGQRPVRLQGVPDPSGQSRFRRYAADSIRSVRDKFTQDTHQRCWKRYGVRPSGGAKAPAVTQEKYCVYDEPHKDYLYTPAWVEFLIERMKIDGEYECLYKKK